jgi:hypothetical protein
MFIARLSNHIQEDIKRNWSSWNFGQFGFRGTYDELQAARKEAIEDGSSFMISGFELFGDEIKNADIRELYDGYWVLVDNVNGNGRGIFGTELSAETIEEAIQESEKSDYSGQGVCFDAREAKLVYSSDDIHIFEIED